MRKKTARWAQGATCKHRWRGGLVRRRGVGQAVAGRRGGHLAAATRVAWAERRLLVRFAAPTADFVRLLPSRAHRYLRFVTLRLARRRREGREYRPPVAVNGGCALSLASLAQEEGARTAQ